NLVSNDTHLNAFPRQFQHQLDEVQSSFSPARVLPVKPRGTNHEVLLRRAADKVFSCQFCISINIQWPGYIGLVIRTSLPSVEEVIGTDVHENSAQVACHESQIPWPKRVNCECPLRFSLAVLHVMHGRRVYNDLRLQLRKHAPD